MKKILLGIACVSFLVPMVLAAEFSTDLRAAQSRALSMSKGYYSQAEWSDLADTLNALLQRADKQGFVAERLELILLKSTVLGDMRGHHADARQLLEASIKEHGHLPMPQVQRLYTQLARVYARQGDQVALDRLLAGYKESPAFDPEIYSIAGGVGPNDPIKIVRPASPGQGSTTVTAMQGQRSNAALAPGASFPAISGTTLSGQTVGLGNYRGRVVLVDCWVRGWHLWERQLSSRVRLYRRFRERGFEIFGVCMGGDTEGLGSYMKGRDMTWQNIVNSRQVSRQLGLHGESASFLLDRNGVIIGRDLAEADLLEAIKAAL